MSGHSKFANIKHKKEKNDAAKGKIFTMIGREIAVAVKEGGPDPANNFKLAQVIAKAKSNNMPNDTIDRGIKKAAGDGNSVNYETCTYEGYGPSGTAIIVKCLTDNKNRTAANVRNCFTKGQGSIGTQGCVSYMFDEKGQIIIDKEECDMDADELMMLALDAGADDFSEEEDSFEITTAPADFDAVHKALEDAGFEVNELDDQVGNWDQATAQQLVANSLSQYGNDVEVVFCNNDAMALGALQSIEAAGRTVGEDIYLVGVDALSEALEDVIAGTMTGTVFNDHFSQSHSAADAAVRYLTGEGNEHYIGCDYVKVTKDNAQDVLDMVK